jgi:hypothetical protein
MRRYHRKYTGSRTSLFLSRKAMKQDFKPVLIDSGEKRKTTSVVSVHSVVSVFHLQHGQVFTFFK